MLANRQLLQISEQHNLQKMVLVKREILVADNL